MIDIANAFILILTIGTVWIATAAIVQKRTVRRRRREHGATNVAA